MLSANAAMPSGIAARLRICLTMVLSSTIRPVDGIADVPMSVQATACGLANNVPRNYTDHRVGECSPAAVPHLMTHRTMQRAATLLACGTLQLPNCRTDRLSSRAQGKWYSNLKQKLLKACTDSMCTGEGLQHNT